MKLNYIFCALTHKDSIDGYENAVVFANDLSVDEYATLGGWLGGDEIQREVSRSVMNKIAESIKKHDNYFSFGDGYMIDLSEDYFTNEGEQQ